MNATCRHVDAPSATVLSYDMPVKMQAVVGQLVPLLARHLAGLAADAQRGIGEEALALRPVRGVVARGLLFERHAPRPAVSVASI